MATLTITDVVRCSLGGKAFRVCKCVVGAEAYGALTVTAGSIDLASIEIAFCVPGTVSGLAVADFQMSTSTGAYVDFNVTTADANDIFYIWAVGT